LRFWAFRWAIDDLPTEPAELTAWTENMFVEKDAILEDMKKDWTGARSLGRVWQEPYDEIGMKRE
jgi:hypothetical protein